MYRRRRRNQGLILALVALPGLAALSMTDVSMAAPEGKGAAQPPGASASSASTHAPAPPSSASAHAASASSAPSLPAVAAHAPAPGSASASPAATPASSPAHKATVAAPVAAKPAPVAASKATGKITAKPGSKVAPKIGRGDPPTRRLVAGGPTYDDAVVDSPELRALRDAERELFPPALPPRGEPWPTELPSPIAAPEGEPRVHASGLPPAPLPSAPPIAEGGHDLSWLAHLQLPDLPVRWDARVVRFLEFFKDDPRGRSLLSIWYRRSGRYRDAIRRTLRRKGIPEDMLWVAMAESAFDPLARSRVGAMGLWQFMPDTAKAYGLPVDRWVDQRLNPVASTEAAAEFLGDLHRRFGSWELAIAAYNMGYWGVAGSVRKYNTNDFWVLSRLEGALPWETTLYVPKILAAAIVGRNPAVFGLQDVAIDPPLEGEEVNVPPGTALAAVAQAAGCTTKEVEALNPELRASRTPPAATGTTAVDYAVKVPSGRAAAAAQALARLHKEAPPLERYVVRFGESLEQIAATRRVPLAKLIELNAIATGEVVRGGTVLLVPPASTASSAVIPTATAQASTPDPKASVAVVPADIFVYPERRRVFYRVLAGDTLREIADTFHVPVDDLRRWNDLDPTARLQEGMTLQLFVPEGADLSNTVVLGEGDVRVLPVGSEEFFAYWESLKGRKRITVTAREGDTLAALGQKYGMTAGMMERINHRSRNEALHAGDSVVVYVAEKNAGASASATDLGEGPLPNGPLPDAPAPDALPGLPLD